MSDFQLPEGHIDIRGLDQASLVAALYNHARVQGFGVLHAKHEEMTPAEARDVLEEYRTAGARRFDYLHGRVMKVDLVAPCDSFNPRLYDRDNGYGAAERIVEELRASTQGRVDA